MSLPILTGWLLFAQQASPAVTLPGGGRASSIEVVLVTMAILVPFAIIAVLGIILLSRHARRERELEHAERLKALETGRTLRQDASFWTPYTLCVAIGVVMPMALFGTAYFASQADAALLPYIWPVAGALGGIGIICGTLMALILKPSNPTEPDHAPDKGRMDPDTFDTAGRRGWDAGPSLQQSNHA